MYNVDVNTAMSDLIKTAKHKNVRDFHLPKLQCIIYIQNSWKYMYMGPEKFYTYEIPGQFVNLGNSTACHAHTFIDV